MKFTNLTRAGMYMQCCHREVEPGGTFIVPWLAAKSNRALRLAMNNGAVAWESEDGEPHIPGSPAVQTEEQRKAAELKRAERRRAKAADAAKRLEAQRRADDEAVKANMARMGNFNVPQVKSYKKVQSVASREKPISREDVISGDKPRSLADIVRHNRAVKAFGTGKA